jgi:monomeric sarcosine oxidase
MARNSYDAIVLGTGGVGSAAAWQLAQRGVRTLGIDRFSPPHDRGSSHGHTRIIRQAYFEHADYVPLCLRSYELWRELQKDASEELLREIGLLQVGPADGVVVPGVIGAAAKHGLHVERVTPAEISKQWPAFRAPEDLAGAFEPRGGMLRVERCVAACANAAKKSGANFVHGVEVFDWSAGDDIRVRTSAGEFTTGKLVVSAGAWAGTLLSQAFAAIPPQPGAFPGGEGIGLEVRRKVVMWFDGDPKLLSVDASCPAFLFELPNGVFYGLPGIDGRGLKAGDHSKGDVVADPIAVDRALRAEDRTPVEQFLAQCIPTARTPCMTHSVCLYTMSPDENFIVDRMPDDPRIVFAAGLSGHGFKFAPVLGEALADLATEGKTNLPIGFLGLARFGK